MNQTGGWDWNAALAEMPGRWTEVAEELFSFSDEMRRRGCKSVYDLGCGVGRHTVFLCKQGFDVTASDVSSSAIEKTRRNVNDAGVAAKLHQIDMKDWPFDDKQFDALLAFNVVYHSTKAQLENLLGQVKRVLRDDGLLFITFKSTLDSDYGKGTRIAPFTFAPTSGIEKGIPHYYVDQEEIQRLMSGFKLLSVTHKQEYPVSPQDQRLRAHWIVQASNSSGGKS